MCQLVNFKSAIVGELSFLYIKPNRLLLSISIPLKAKLH